MLLFGFLDGFFFSFFLLLLLLVFVVYRIGRAALYHPLKAIGWANTLHSVWRGFAGHRDNA